VYFHSLNNSETAAKLKTTKEQQTNQDGISSSQPPSDVSVGIILVNCHHISEVSPYFSGGALLECNYQASPIHRFALSIPVHYYQQPRHSLLKLLFHHQQRLGIRI